MSVNKVILIGRLGADPELKNGASGTPVCRFSVATNETFKDKSGEQQKHTEWHSVVCFGRLAEVSAELLGKSREVYVEGTIRSRRYEDRDGTERKVYSIVAHWMQILSPATNRNGPKASASPVAKPTPADEGDNPFREDEAGAEDVPF